MCQDVKGLVISSQAKNEKGLHYGHQASLSGEKCYFGSPGYTSASLLTALDSKGLGNTTSRCQHLCCFMHSKLSRKMEAKGAGVTNWPSTLNLVSVVELADLSGTPTWFCYSPINDKEKLAILKKTGQSLSAVHSFLFFFFSVLHLNLSHSNFSLKPFPLVSLSL